MAQTLISRIYKWDLIKLKNFSKAKDTINKKNLKPTDCQKIFTNPTTDRGLMPKIYEELKRLNSKEPNNQNKKWGTEQSKHFSRQ